MSASEARYFTLDEANLILEVVRPLMGRILDIRKAILEKQPEVWPAAAKAAGNGGSIAASQMALDFDLLDQLIRQVQATGAVIKDIDTGLVDFLSIRSGREVYLCWQFGENEIAFWHELDAGYQERRAL